MAGRPTAVVPGALHGLPTGGPAAEGSVAVVVAPEVGDGLGLGDEVSVGMGEGL
jgi:hypothetical protein